MLYGYTLISSVFINSVKPSINTGKKFHFTSLFM